MTAPPRSWLDNGAPLPEKPAIIEFDRGSDAGPRTIVESRWKLTVFPLTGQGFYGKEERHYDACIRGPLIIAGPGVKAGQTRHESKRPAGDLLYR